MVIDPEIRKFLRFMVNPPVCSCMVINMCGGLDV